MRLLSVALCVTGAYASKQPQAGGPIGKVIDLLEKIKGELNSEAADDADYMAQFGAHYSSEKTSLTDMINTNKAILKKSATTIAGASNDEARLTGEIQHANEEIVDRRKRLAEAEKTEHERFAAFTERETELSQAVAALGRAVDLLSAHNPKPPKLEFMQSEQGMKQLSRQLSKAVSLYTIPMLPYDKQALKSFIQQPTFAKYQSQSGQIFGILEQMKINFSKDHKEAVETNQNALKAHEEFKNANAQALELAEKSIVANEATLAQSRADLAEAKRDQAENKEDLARNEKSLSALEEKNTRKQHESTSRTKARNVEISSVDEAIDILKDGIMTIGTFLQTSSSATQKAAMKAKSVEGTMQVIFNTIDKRIAAIQQEIVNDQALHAKCQEDEKVSRATLKDLENKKAILDSSVETADGHVLRINDTLGLSFAAGSPGAPAGVLQDIENVEKEVLDKSNNRQAEYELFAKDIKEMKETSVVLKKAIDALAVYAPAGFIQKRQEPVAGAAQTEAKNSGGSKAVSLLKEILADTDANIARLNTEEKENVEAYDSEVKVLNDRKKALEDKQASLVIEKASKQTELANLGQALAGNAALTDSETQFLTNLLEETCGFINAHKAEKVQHAEEEIRAMQLAKQSLESSFPAIAHAEQQTQAGKEEALRDAAGMNDANYVESM